MSVGALDKMFKPSTLGSGLSPWVRRCCGSYAKRMRVTNFTKAGNAMFHDMIFRAVNGDAVYFIMVPNGRTDKIIPVEQSVVQATTNFAKKQESGASIVADVAANEGSTEVSGNDDTVKASNGDYRDLTQKAYQVQSGLDPVDLNTVNDERYAELLGRVANIGAENGVCYDENNEAIPGIWCLSLSEPPITDNANVISDSVVAIERYVNANLDRILVPNRYAANTDPDTEWDERKPEEKPNANIPPSANADPTDPRKLMHVDNGGQGVSPVTLGQFAQWDNKQIQSLKQDKALEFMGETNIPPSDLPELQTLSLTAQSLVSNREPYVSRVAAIKTQVEAVFQSAGIPELQWDILFPYTAQDIASIGDALGKGATPQALRGYQFS